MKVDVSRRISSFSALDHCCHSHLTNYLIQQAKKFTVAKLHRFRQSYVPGLLQFTSSDPSWQCTVPSQCNRML